MVFIPKSFIPKCVCVCVGVVCVCGGVCVWVGGVCVCVVGFFLISKGQYSEVFYPEVHMIIRRVFFFFFFFYEGSLIPNSAAISC